MKGYPIRSQAFDTFEEGEGWIAKQDARDDFVVLSYGCALYADGKYRAYVWGRKTLLSKLI